MSNVTRSQTYVQSSYCITICFTSLLHIYGQPSSWSGLMMTSFMCRRRGWRQEFCSPRITIF